MHIEIFVCPKSTSEVLMFCPFKNQLVIVIKRVTAYGPNVIRLCIHCKICVKKTRTKNKMLLRKNV